MSSENPSQSEKDDVMGAAIAIVLATQMGDTAAVFALLGSVNPIALAATLSGLCDRLGTIAAGSSERWRAMLQAWQPGQQLGDGTAP